jgi:phage terminase large subunit
LKGGRKKSKREKEADILNQEEQRPIQVDMQATKLFFENMDCNAKVIANRGSAGSSKSFSVAQVLTYKFASETNKRILILRKSLPFLKVSTLWLMYDMLDRFGIRPRVEEQKNMMNFLFNGNLIHFGSVDDPQKIKSSEWNYQWFEEATEFTEDDFNMVRLYNRRKSYDHHPNQIYLSFNPVDEYHWIKNKLLKEEDTNGNVYDKDGTWAVHEIHSTYKDNPFLPADYIKELENLQFQDYNRYRVYALGEWGRVEEIIYTNYVSVKEVPPGGEVIYGLDFGFNKPSALVKCTVFPHEDKNIRYRVYEEELLYQEKLTNSDLIKQLDKLIPEDERRRRVIYADSAEPDRIQEIKNSKLGFIVKIANKQVKEGIDFIKRLDINILEGSLNLFKEKSGYGWKKDRNGQVLDEPIKFRDHLMDAERYALYSHLKGSRDYTVRWLN